MDIHYVNATGSEVRVNWALPECTDNSGALPSIFSEKQAGSFFDVPSDTEVLYEVTDDNGNENFDCSFRITVDSECLAGGVKN